MKKQPEEFPSLQYLVQATVAALRSLGGSASNEEIHDTVVEQKRLSQTVVEFPHKHGSMSYLAYRLHWARTYLKKAGFLNNTSRGVWTLTPAGREASEASLSSVVRVVRGLNYETRKSKNQKDEPESDDINDPIGTWEEKLLQQLGKMRPDAFERLCQRLLRESGFTKVEVTGRSGDGGIDGQGVLRVNLVSFQVLFQCKRWQSSVGASVVRDFRGAMVGRADKGLIIATSTFSRDARAEATRDGAPAIDLVDGEDLCRLLKERGLGVKIRMVEEIDIDEEFIRSI
jgi:restriction system protein